MNERILYLVSRWTARVISDEERSELFALLRDPALDDDMKAAFNEMWWNMPVDRTMDSVVMDAVFRRVTGAPVVRMPVRRRLVLRWVAAAVIILAIPITILFIQQKAAVVQVVHVLGDIPAPDHSRASVTLADGQTIYLDSVHAGVLAQQGNSRLVKSAGGDVVFEGGAAGAVPEYNTLFNPRGSKALAVKLSDGTLVWLNSGSSLRCPGVFTGKTREVEVSGEAYFEVSQDASKPFHVRKGALDVTVLGTHFNVNAYDDDPSIRVTLLEGSVAVKEGHSAVTLRPNEQAVRMADAPVIIDHAPDVESAMAWKNGRFLYTDATLDEILKEISRYYDADILYTQKIPGHFVVDVSRNEPVSKLLQILELTKRVHFAIEGKKITVTP